jgi:hypothetical protein
MRSYKLLDFSEEYAQGKALKRIISLASESKQICFFKYPYLSDALAFKFMRRGMFLPQPRI